MPPRTPSPMDGWMECDFTTWVTNCSLPGRGFLDCTGPFLLGATPSSSPLRPPRGNRIRRHFTWEGRGREGERACNDPPLPRNFARSPASLPPQFFTEPPAGRTRRHALLLANWTPPRFYRCRQVSKIIVRAVALKKPLLGLSVASYYISCGKIG